MAETCIPFLVRADEKRGSPLRILLVMQSDERPFLFIGWPRGHGSDIGEILHIRLP